MPERLRVVVIDDNPDDRELAIRELERSFGSIELRQVIDAADLAQVLADGNFDAVITDYQLKWTTGLHILREVRTRYPDVVVVMFTNTGTQEVAVEAMKEGLDDYVIKAPAHFIRLPAAVRAALDHAQARDAARRALASREQFLTVAAHELRTPLTTINGVVQGALLRLRRLQAGPPEIALEQLPPIIDILDRARRQIRRLNRLQEDFLAAVRVESGEMPTAITTVDVVELAREAIANQLDLAPGRVISLDSPNALHIRADPDWVLLVLANLLANAVKFSPTAAPVEAHITGEDGFARFAVRDHGPGVPPEEQERIWDRFYRQPDLSHVSGSSVGLGLGLAISRALIQRMGGATGLSSESGQGATFWYTLPLANDENA